MPEYYLRHCRVKMKAKVKVHKRDYKKEKEKVEMDGKEKEEKEKEEKEMDEVERDEGEGRKETISRDGDGEEDLGENAYRNSRAVLSRFILYASWIWIWKRSGLGRQAGLYKDLFYLHNPCQVFFIWAGFFEYCGYGIENTPAANYIETTLKISGNYLNSTPNSAMNFTYRCHGQEIGKIFVELLIKHAMEIT